MRFACAYVTVCTFVFVFVCVIQWQFIRFIWLFFIHRNPVRYTDACWKWKKNPCKWECCNETKTFQEGRVSKLNEQTSERTRVRVRVLLLVRNWEWTTKKKNGGRWIATTNKKKQNKKWKTARLLNGTLTTLFSPAYCFWWVIKPFLEFIWRNPNKELLLWAHTDTLTRTETHWCSAKWTWHK